MTRLHVLLGAATLFHLAPLALRNRDLPPRRRVVLGALMAVGLLVTTSTLLVSLVLPETLRARSLDELLMLCDAALRSIVAQPAEHLPELVAAGALLLVVARAGWSLILSGRRTRRAVVAGEPCARSPGGIPVVVLPLELPEAYSTRRRGGQIVLTQGLLSDLDRDERHAVLLHEEAHVLLRHHAMIRLVRASECGVLGLPAGRWLRDGFEQAIEEEADEYVTKRAGDPLPLANAVAKAALASLEHGRGTLALQGAGAVRRIERLLDGRPPPRWASAAGAAGLVALVSALVASSTSAAFAVVAAGHHLLGIGVQTLCPV